MDNKLALTTAVTLAYRESIMSEPGGVSTDVIRELLDLIKVSEVNIGQGTDGSAIANVKNTLLDMCVQSDISVYNSDDLLIRLKINVGEDEKWYNALERSIKTKLDELAINKSILVLRTKVKQFINQEKVAKIFRERSREWNFKYSEIEDPAKYIQDVVSDFEAIMTHSNVRDNAIVDEIDFDKIETVEAVTKKVEDIANGSLIWKTGHQDLNDMFQGGFREGEEIVVGALPHMDKTGTTLTIFRQLATYNEPRIRKPGKKPTLVRLSFEDPMTNNVNYLYKNIKYNETGEFVDETGVPYDEIAKVVANHMVARGFGIRMAYVDPSDWSYRNLQNYVLKLEAEGCDVQVLMVDYLSMIPTTGCRQGPTGSDLQDLFRRMRNFCKSRGVLFITPHQLSTQARELTRGTVTNETFLQFIAGKGFWQDAKGLDREFDGAFYVHLIEHESGTYKAFQRDKHRWSGILDEVKKFFIYKYPYKMPIPDDLGKERIGMRRIGRVISNVATDMFNFDS